MILHEQDIVHQFTSTGVEEWFLSLESFGFALASSWRRLMSELKPGGDIRDIEQGLRRLARQLQQVLLELVVDGLKQRDDKLPIPRCPKCLRPMWTNRKQGLTLQFLEGSINLLRHYRECRDCGIYCFPLDADLGLMAEGECTPQFAQDLCLMAIQLPGEASVRLLAALTGRQISRTLLHEQVQREGAALVELERSEAERLWPFTEKGTLRRVSGTDLPVLRSPPPPAGTLIVEIDGVFANLGQEPQIRDEIRRYDEEKKQALARGEPFSKERPSPFREVRQARFYRLLDRVTKPTRNGKKRSRIMQSETVTVVNDPELFARRLNAAAHVWQAEKYSKVQVVGDGGDFIWECANTILAAQHQTLDNPHANSHIHGCAKALFGDKSPQTRAWGNRWCESVSNTGPDALLEELHRLQQQSWPAEATRVLDNLADYVTKHRHRMDYPTFRALGLPIASGAIESANRQVVGDRCKRSGMSWARAGLQRILSLVAAYLSGNWLHAFTAIGQHRRYRLPAAPLGTSAQDRVVQSIDPAACPRGNLTPSPAPASLTRAPKRSQHSPRSLVPQRKLSRLISSGTIERTQDGALQPAAAPHP